MAKIIDDISRTFQEYLLLPGFTKKEHVSSNVSLKVPIQKFSEKEGIKASLNIPIISAAMQAVTGSELAIALARKGGCGFIYCSQGIEQQAQMVKEVKLHKAGFVTSDSNLSPDATLQDAVDLRERTGHSTIAITEDGSGHGRLLGILTSKDFWEFKDDLTNKIEPYYTKLDSLVYGEEGISLQDATEKLWKNKKECLPIIDKDGNLHSLVFRRDYFDHKTNPDELTDENKRLFVGAAINTHDYKERSEALIAAGADCLCLDSSDGLSEWQVEAAKYIKDTYGDKVILGGGNVVTGEGFRILVEQGNVDFVKIGIGGGSICITREQKGLGRGQASAVLDVVNARNEYYKETGVYVPLCSDGGLSSDTQLIVALAMGADFVMMGRYFAMTSESPNDLITFKGRLYKPYWGEGSNRARNWQRYKDIDSDSKNSKDKKLVFEEGVDAYVPYSGPLSEKVSTTTAKLKAAMCNTGNLTISDFHQNAELTRISPMTLVEGGTSNVEQLDRITSAD